MYQLFFSIGLMLQVSYAMDLDQSRRDNYISGVLPSFETDQKTLGSLIKRTTIDLTEIKASPKKSSTKTKAFKASQEEKFRRENKQIGSYFGKKEPIPIKASAIPINPLLESLSDKSRKDEKNGVSLKRKRESENEKECDVMHVSGTGEHFALLQKMLTSATGEILITSQSITLMPPEIYDLFRDAVDRCSKIYVVYNNSISEKAKEFFSKYKNIVLEKKSFHANYLIIDNHALFDNHILVGSYSWLDFSNIGEEFTENFDGSFKISGSRRYIGELKEKIWSETIPNWKGFSERKVDCVRCPLPESSYVTLLTTADEHEKFLIDVCRNAKKTIQIYSPFVTYKTAIERLEKIFKELKSEVEFHLFVGEEFEKLDSFVRKYDKLEEKKKVYLNTRFHQNTLIVDGATLGEGSFNWLSSAKSLTSNFYNQDASLFVQGPLAQKITRNLRCLV